MAYETPTPDQFPHDTQAKACCAGVANPKRPLSAEAQYLFRRIDQDVVYMAERLSKLVLARAEIMANPDGAELIAKYRSLV